MVKSTIKITIILLASVLLLACNATQQVDLEVEMTVTLDGKPASQARILLDGNEIGFTDADGHFLKGIRKLPGEEVQLSVYKDTDGYRITPWEDSFVTKLQKNGAVETYSFKVALEATKYFTVIVTDDGEGELLEGADIQFAGKAVGKTNVSGEYVHEYTRMPKKGLKLSVAKKGYDAWKKSVRAQPGQHYEVSLKKKRKPTVVKSSPVPETVTPPLKSKPAVVKVPKKKKTTTEKRKTTTVAKKKSKRATISVVALTEAYGVASGIPGIGVSINGKPIGKTNFKGVWSYHLLSQNKMD